MPSQRSGLVLASHVPNDGTRVLASKKPTVGTVITTSPDWRIDHLDCLAYCTFCLASFQHLRVVMRFFFLTSCRSALSPAVGPLCPAVVALSPAVGPLFMPAFGYALFLRLTSTIHLLSTSDPRLHLVVHFEPQNLFRSEVFHILLHLLVDGHKSAFTSFSVLPRVCHALCRTRSAHLPQNHQKVTCGRLLQPFTAKTPLVPKQFGTALLPQGNDPNLQFIDVQLMPWKTPRNRRDSVVTQRDQSHRIARNRVFSQHFLQRRLTCSAMPSNQPCRNVQVDTSDTILECKEWRVIHICFIDSAV